VIQGLPILRKKAFHNRLLKALNAKIKETKDVALAEKLSKYVAKMGG